MQKLNFYGVGPKIGRITLPWLAVTIILSLIFKGTFRYFPDDRKIIFYIGLGLVAAGLIMYFSTIPFLLQGIKETRLVTRGAFYLCCNPLYTAIILFIIPGVSFMMNSWLIISTSLVAYILFKLYIHDEQREMESFFGNDYLAYKAVTPEFFPFPMKKLFGLSK